MCPACQAEYDDPLNRRFHAQPNACWQCGPRLELWDRRGQNVHARNPIAEAVAGLKAGLVVAVKGSVDFISRWMQPILPPLPCCASASGASRSHSLSWSRTSRQRVKICQVSVAAERVLSILQRPIVLLPKLASTDIAERVAPRNRDLGVFLPYTPLHHLLFSEGGFTSLVMTSANRSEEPIAIDNREALERLAGLADLFLVHDRAILLRCDDSVVRIVGNQPRQLRRSRGYVPVPIFLTDEVPSVLAVGGELKNTICLTQGKHAFLSQHVGDLENLESFRFFEEAIEHLERILEIQPRIIAYDLHPGYFSTKWALAQKNSQLVGVQHHHAHVASCMAENHLDGQVIGIALDGTGYGTDGKIWGGEMLLADYCDFQRVGHLQYVARCLAEIRQSVSPGEWRSAFWHITSERIF